MPARVHVLVATPAAHGLVTTQYTTTLIRVVTGLMLKGLGVSYRPFSFSDIEDSRNYLASLALADRAVSHLLFIDSDMEFSETLVLRMLARDCAVAGAVYPRRDMDLQAMLVGAGTADLADADRRQAFISGSLDYIVSPPEAGGAVLPQVDQGFVRVRAVGMGACLISRRALETMVERGAAAARKLTFADVPVYGFFDKIREPDGTVYSEDFSFCRRWTAQCGGEVWACVDERIGHVGKFTYSGTYSDRLKAGRV